MQLVFIGYAFITVRGVDQSWQMKAVQVLPIFVVPALGFAVYTGFVSFIRMRKYLKPITLLEIFEFILVLSHFCLWLLYIFLVLISHLSLECSIYPFGCCA